MPFAEDSNHVKFSLWEKQFLNGKRHGAYSLRSLSCRSCGLAVLRSLLKRHIAYKYIAYNTSPKP